MIGNHNLKAYEIMKKLYILVMSLFIASSSYAAEAKKELVIVADEWCPFNCEPDSDKPGYVVEIAKEIFAKHGINVTYQIVPWARALQGTADGDYDAAICASRSEGKTLIYPDEIVGLGKNKFFVKSDSDWKYTDEKSLESISIGVIADYSYGPIFDKYLEKHKSNNAKIQFTSGENASDLNLMKLVNGRINATYGHEFVTEYEINEHGYTGQIKQAGEVIRKVSPYEDYYYLALSPKNPDSSKYAKIFSDGIKEMRKSGQLDKIMHKYGLHDWMEE
jgi:polar amino acid transport system substrate-binding protein